MAYVKTTWVDEVTPLSAANLNNLETGVSDALTGTGPNLLAGGDFAGDAADYWTVPVSLTISSVQGPSPFVRSYRGSSLKVTGNPGSTVLDQPASRYTSLVPGQKYTASIYMQNASPDVRSFNIRGFFFDEAGNFLASPPEGADGAIANVVPGTNWTRLTYTFTAPASATGVRARLTVRCAGFANGDVYYFDDAQLEEGSYATKWRPYSPPSKLTLALTGVQSFSFTGLDGENDWGYELSLAGKLNGSVNNTYVLVLRPNGDATQTYYPQTSFKRYYQDPLGTINDNAFVGEPATVLGMTIFRSAWLPSGGLLSRVRFLSVSGVKRVMHSESAFAPTGDNRHIEHFTSCYYVDAVTPITSLGVTLLTYQHLAPPADSTFTGRATLKPLGAT